MKKRIVTPLAFILVLITAVISMAAYKVNPITGGRLDFYIDNALDSTGMYRSSYATASAEVVDKSYAVFMNTGSMASLENTTGIDTITILVDQSGTNKKYTFSNLNKWVRAGNDSYYILASAIGAAGGVQGYDSDLSTWAALTPSANFQTLVTETFAQMRTSGGFAASGANSDITSLSGITTPLSIAQGGTNSSTALSNNRILTSQSGAIKEASAINAARVLISDANGIPTHSAISSTTLGYLDATSSIQGQFNGLPSSYQPLASQLTTLAATSLASTWTTSGPSSTKILSEEGVVGFVEEYVTYHGGEGSMTYPGAGIPNSTGSAWGTSYTLATSFSAPGSATAIPSTSAIVSYVSSIGGGNFNGPGSSTDNAIVRFDGTGGITGQNSLATISDAGTINIPSGQTYNINGSALTYSNVGAAPAAGNSSIVSVGTITSGTWNGTAIAVGYGGTGLSSGTSGGIPYFSSTSTMASSAALTASQLIIGGGAGAAPSSLAAGSEYQVLRMGASAPAYGQIDISRSAAVTGILAGTNGGTGVNNSTRLLTYGGNVTFSGAYNMQFTVPGAYTYTLPSATSTLSGLGVAETFSGVKTFSVQPIFSTLTASKPVFTDSSKGLVSTGTLGADQGGTGIANNAASTITISGNYATTLTVSGTTGVTLPTSGTLYGTASSSITSAQLATSLSNETGTAGYVVFSDSPTFTTQITTPKIYYGGNFTFDAYNASANTTVAIGNSAATYVANVTIDGNLTVSGNITSAASGASYVGLANNTSFTPDAGTYDFHFLSGVPSYTSNGTVGTIACLGIAQTFTYVQDFTAGIRMPAAQYVNWGAAAGSSGYGIRESGGYIQFKNSGGDWANIGTSTGMTSSDINTSSKLAAIVGDEVGTGYLVFNTAPTFVASITPTSNDGAAIGTSSLMWSDLFLASGSVVNFNNGDVTLTHGSNVLTLAGGDLALGSNNLTLTGYIAFGSDPADTGAIRLSNNQYIYAEASPATTDIQLIGVDSSEAVSIGYGASVVSINPPVNIGGIISLLGGGTVALVNTVGGSANAFTLSGSLEAMDGSDTFRALNIDYSNTDHVGSGNYIYGIYIDAITGSSGATEYAINIGSGWDKAIYTTGDISLGQATFADANASPDAVGELLYDNTVTGLDDGAIVWYDDDEIQILLGLDSSTTLGSGTDGYQVTYHYNSGNGYFDLQAAGSGGSATPGGDGTPDGQIQFANDANDAFTAVDAFYYDDSTLYVTNINYTGTLTGPAATDPYLFLNETDGTDWYIGLYDTTADRLEFRRSATVNTDVDMYLTTAGLYVTGDLTITGDDLFMATNTSGYFLVADGTNYNPVAASGDLTLASTGAFTIADNSVQADDIEDMYEYALIPIAWGVDGSAAPTALNSTGRTPWKYREFSSSTDQDVNFVWQIPADATVGGSSNNFWFRVHYLVTNATGPSASEGVAFSLAGVSEGDNDATNATKGTAVTVTDDELNAAQWDIMQTGWSGAVTITNAAAGEMAELNFERTTADSVDDYGQVVGVAFVEIRYVKNPAR